MKQRFRYASARSFVGRVVNLHLLTGEVFPCVTVKSVRKEWGKGHCLAFKASGQPMVKVPLNMVDYATPLHPNFLELKI